MHSLTRISIAIGLAAFCATTAVFADGLGLPTVKPEKAGMSSERLERISRVLAPFVEEGQVPGLITAVARDGKIVHFEVMGHQDVENQEPMRPDTIFRMYSMTKPVTGVAVMLLYEEGLININEPISKYLPEFKSMKVFKGKSGGEVKTESAKRPITIKHLLTHTSGLSYDFFPTPLGKIYQDAGLGMNDAIAKGTTLAEYVEILAEQPLAAQPGTQWHYSLAMDVLGRLVEVVSGQSYRDFCKTRIFDPLGMVDADFYVPAEKHDRFAACYSPNGNGGMTRIDDPETGVFSELPSLHLGGAGLVCTASDYLRFAQMLVNGGELDGVQLLSPTTVAFMTRDHLGPEFGDSPLAMLALGTQGFGAGMGFGFCGGVITDVAQTGTAGSNGEYTWGGAASTDFWIDSEQRLVGMVLTQLLPSATYPTRTLMHQMTYQAIVE